MCTKLVCALLSGRAENSDAARKIAESYSSCPYVYFMTTKDNQLYATFFLPERQKWWIEHVEQQPEQTFGLKEAKVIFSDVVHWPKKPAMKLPKKRTEFSPCGADCSKCSAFQRCLHCPGTKPAAGQS